MSTLRKQTRSGYTHICNELIDAEGLSYRARGIAMHLLSKPDDWIIKIEYLMRHGKEGKKAIRTAMQELAQYGFLMRDRVLAADGKITTVTYIADYPAFIEVGTVERRILGYEPKSNADIPLSDTSAKGTSQNRHVDNGEVLPNTKKPTPDPVSSKRKKKNYVEPVPEAKRNYRPAEYSDIILG